MARGVSRRASRSARRIIAGGAARCPCGRGLGCVCGVCCAVGADGVVVHAECLRRRRTPSRCRGRSCSRRRVTGVAVSNFSLVQAGGCQRRRLDRCRRKRHDLHGLGEHRHRQRHARSEPVLGRLDQGLLEQGVAGRRRTQGRSTRSTRPLRPRRSPSRRTAAPTTRPATARAALRSGSAARRPTRPASPRCGSRSSRARRASTGTARPSAASSETFNTASATTSWKYGLALPADDVYTVHVQATDTLGNAQTSGDLRGHLGRSRSTRSAPPAPSISSGPAGRQLRLLDERQLRLHRQRGRRLLPLQARRRRLRAPARRRTYYRPGAGQPHLPG